MRELSVPSDLPAPTEHNIADYVFANAAKRPAHVAIRRHTGSGWADVTSTAFAAEVNGLAKGLIAHGVQRGDRLAVMSRTRYEWTLVDFAALAVGAVVVPIYETSSAEQVQWILTDSGSRAIFVETGAHAALVDGVRAEAPSLTDVWLLEGDAIADLTERGASHADEEVLSRREQTNLEDLASIIYTSGTTGRPKGCELTHANFVHEVAELQVSLSEFFNDTTSTLLFLPIAHVFGRAIEIGAVATGCTLGHTLDVKNLLDDLGTFQPTFVLSVPRVFEKVYNTAWQKAQASGRGKIFERAERVAISYSRAAAQGRIPALVKVEHALFDHLVYSKLRAALGGRCVAAVSGGAPLGDRLGHFFRGAGVTIYEGYGLTETTAGVCINTPASIQVGSVGRPVGGIATRIADDGELLVRGEMVFRGYWNNEAATHEAIDDEGWFHTGDIGEINDSGFVAITGRKKELIVTAAGKNVAPAVLEDRVRAHWLVSQVLVVGDRQPYIAALITIDSDALPQWLAANGKPADTQLADLVGDPKLREDVQAAITEANKAVSNAEAIKRFVILADDWTEARGQITPSLKLKRNVVQTEYAGEIEAMFATAKPD